MSKQDDLWNELLAHELERARQHGQFNSAHEAYAVLLEEVDEFWEQVRMKRQDRSRDLMLAELVQIAAVARKAAESLGCLPAEPVVETSPR